MEYVRTTKRIYKLIYLGINGLSCRHYFVNYKYLMGCLLSNNILFCFFILDLFCVMVSNLSSVIMQRHALFWKKTAAKRHINLILWIYHFRIGRSGRFGRKGVAINFVKSDDIRILRDIEQYYSTQIDEMPMNGRVALCCQSFFSLHLP